MCRGRYVGAEGAGHVGRGVVAGKTEVCDLDLGGLGVGWFVLADEKDAGCGGFYLRDLRSRWMMGGSLVCRKIIPFAICLARLMRVDHGRGWLDSCNRSKRVDFIDEMVPRRRTR